MTTQNHGIAQPMQSPQTPPCAFQSQQINPQAMLPTLSQKQAWANSIINQTFGNETYSDSPYIATPYSPSRNASEPEMDGRISAVPLDQKCVPKSGYPCCYGNYQCLTECICDEGRWAEVQRCRQACRKGDVCNNGGQCLSQQICKNDYHAASSIVPICGPVKLFCKLASPNTRMPSVRSRHIHRLLFSTCRS